MSGGTETDWEFADESQAVLAVCSVREIQTMLTEDTVLTSEQISQMSDVRLAAVGGPLADLIDRLPAFMTEGDVCWGKPSGRFIDRLIQQQG